MPAFDPDPNLPGYTYLRFADYLTAEIDAGRLRAGSRLAGEQELAQVHGVSLGTVRRAMVVLRERGLVATWPSKGSFVAGEAAPPAGAGADGEGDEQP
ncbi:winged helix-turn-helix domain-containing protein [Jiangella alba]|uniref:Regulatory protein, gntR family n=1 Tax=Jiangella alba TaxID=561176 RepID=A0A1H5HL38_9ACTN|nr:winged helix-turn-helix domain-containing protein [Jiangella alba]SEE28525.1 regulatory protein, gntR family [Jiangella alba]